jgi:hypothetical protein
MRKVNYLEIIPCVSRESEGIPAGVNGPFFKTSDGRVFQICIDYYGGGAADLEDSIALREVIFFDDSKVEV